MLLTHCISTGLHVPLILGQIHVLIYSLLITLSHSDKMSVNSQASSACLDDQENRTWVSLAFLKFLVIQIGHSTVQCYIINIVVSYFILCLF